MFALPPAPVVTAALAAAVAYWQQSPPCQPTVTFGPIDDSGTVGGIGAETFVTQLVVPMTAADAAPCSIVFNTNYPIQGNDGSWLMFCSTMTHEVGHLLGLPDETTDPNGIEYYGPDANPPIPASCQSDPLLQAPAPVLAPAVTHHRRHHRRRHHRHQAR